MNLISHIIDRYTHDDEKRLALKISIASFLILITILTLIIGASYIYQRNGAYQEFLSENKFIENRDILENIENNPPIMPGIRGGFGHRGPRDIIVFDHQKQVVKNDFLDLTTDDIDHLFSIAGTNNTSRVFGGRSYLVSKNDFSTYTIFFFRDLTPLRDFHLTLIFIAIGGSVVTLLAIFLLAQYLAQITIAPIREQSRELEAYSHNVAHELRTPLSVIRSNLELLRIKPELRFINSTDEEVTGMERIIESLLFLAKPDESDIRKELDITTKTAEIIEKYTHENAITYSHDKKHIQKKSNEELYRRILCNLIENAIKYKSGGTIEIKLSKESIRISNDIECDLSEEEQKNLTKVFYQGDSSRNSSGYGLGLALVTKIVEISGWTMNIRAQDKKFTVEIGF